MSATSSGILVICTRFAAKVPMMAPATTAPAIKENAGLKSATKKVVITASNMPIMPKVLPWREVVGEDKPRSARMNNTEEMRYEIAVRFDMSLVSRLVFF